MKTPRCPRCHSLYSVKFEVSEPGGRPGKHPLLLRCGHTFCETCLQKCSQSDSAIECPTCQMPTKVGSGTELQKYLYPDLYTVGLIWTKRMDLELQSQRIYNVSERNKRKEARRVSSAKIGSKCNECHVGAATCQCFKCDCVMCRPCFDKIHQMSKSLKKHQPVPFSSASDERLPRKMRSRNCTTHEQCQIEYFCNNDNQAICSRCVIMGDHKGHDVQTMEDKNKECLAEMESAVVTAQETVWRLEKSEKNSNALNFIHGHTEIARATVDLRSRIASSITFSVPVQIRGKCTYSYPELITKSVPSTQFDYKSVEEEVRLYFQELHSLLQAREEQLQDDIREASLNTSKPIHEVKTYLEDEKVKLEAALVDAARAMQGNISRLIDADLILERLKKAKDVPCMVEVKKDLIDSSVRFSFDSSLRDAISAFGKISASNPNQMLTLSLPGSDAEKPPHEELRNYTASDIDAMSNTDTESCTDSVSVIVEEGKEEIGCTGATVAADLVKTDPASQLPSKRLVVGHCEKVRVTHIRTPAQFYVQLFNQFGELDMMQRHINQHCRNQQRKKDQIDHLETGCLVLAQFSQDKVWYRARIMDIIELEEKDGKETISYEVFFTDYGNSEIVSSHKIRKIKKRFETIPAFAYECSLYDILPVDETEGWSTESVKTMLQMTSTGPMIMTVVNTLGGMLEVDLSKPGNESLCVDDRPVSVRDSLVFLEMAIFNTRSATSPSAPRIKRDFITMPRVRDGTVVDIGINCVHSPSLFYSQMFTERSHEYLNQLLVSMQEIYSEETRHLYTIFCPRKGMICAAKYQKDNNWYRARVTGLPGDRKVEVQFVDYGNVEIVEHSDVCKILDNYSKYPAQAMECSLADVEPLENGQWSKEAKAWFRSLIELQMCQMRVTAENKKPNSLVGVLYAINTDNTVCCVNYELVRLGFANSTGQWSQEESFLGITLMPRPPHELAGASSVSTSSPLNAYPVRFSTNSASKVASSKNRGNSYQKPLHSRQKIRHSASPPQKSGAAYQDFAFENGRSRRSASSSPKPVGEKMAEATCIPGSGSVVVLISGYQSPVHFYIQLEEKQKELLNLMAELASYETEPPSDHQWQEGEFCVAKYSQDNRWYRSRITRKAEDMFEVLLVDFGYTDLLPAVQLHPLKQIHGKAECFAELCHLADILPAGSTDRTKWSNTAKEFVLRKTQGKRLYVKLEGERVPDYGLPVDILIEETIPETAFDPQKYVYVSLVTMIKEQGLALPMKRQKSCEPPSPSPSSQPDTFHTKVITTFSDSQPSIPSHIEDETTEETNEESKDPVILNEPVIIVQPDLDVVPHPPPASTTLEVLPVYVDYEGIIYAHDFAEEKEFAIWVEKLNAYATREAQEGQLEVKVGQICLAYFNTDSTWYRARVLEMGEHNVKVKYIDFGNTDRVDKSKLKLISPELCCKPQVAYELRLHNIKPNTVDGSWPVTFLEYIHSKVVNSKCTAEVKGNTEQYPLEVDLFLKDGSDISSLLLETGVVTKENEMEEFYERSSDISNILIHSNPYFPLRLGNKGDIVHGLVTHMELPNLIYIQRTAAPDTDLPEGMQEFVQMMEDLNSLPPQTPMLEDVPASGEICSAKFSNDDRWYRGLVVKSLSSTKSALIYYVDYGNSEVVPLDRLRVLPQRFQDFPAQASRAYLHLDLPENMKQWTLDAYKAMAEAIFLRQHLVLLKHMDPLTVELFSENANLNDTAVLSYQQLINDGIVALPKPFVVADCDDNVIIESELEEECSSATSHGE